MNVYIPSTGFATQGPCPDGFHVPLMTEWNNIINAGVTLGAWTSGTPLDLSIKLKIPLAGGRYTDDGSIIGQSTNGYCRTCKFLMSNGYPTAYGLSINSIFYEVTNTGITTGRSIRPFKNTAVQPDSSWTTIYQGTGSAGIFHNDTLGLISISSDGTTWYTIADKNLGATAVWNSGDTLSESNCGKYYQRGNNYGFPRTGSVTTSTTKVSAAGYGPGNYYSSDTFICVTARPYNWDSSNNQNIRGGEDGNITVSQEVQNIYIGEYKPIYKGEYIEYKMNADSNGYLYIPKAGFSESGNQDCSYSWKVSVDGGAETTYSGTGSAGSSITLSGYTAGSSHTIKIVPTTESYKWAKAYGWYNTAGRTYLTEIIYDASYMGYAVSATNTGNQFRGAQYIGCTNLTKPAEEYLPDTVTTIGTYYRSTLYDSCSSLTYSPEECLPDSVTSIGRNFRHGQYNSCSSLTQIKGWKDLSIGNSYYRYYQYSGCPIRTIKGLSDVGYSSANQDTLPTNHITSVSVPSAYLTNFKNSSNYPWVGITDSKFIGY